ncbi:MAG: SDR family oxidoreductase [Chitinophagaceae bacterium]|jgi:short-subunit dehydrogenase|nr:SDR family oxidoreductase [Chitinophagaceae bacterium]
MLYALVTGASKGIGKAIATELAARKIPLLLVARDEQALDALSASLRQQYQVPVQYLVCDLASDQAPAKLLEWINTNGYELHILVNNAGYGLSGAFENYTATEHTDMMRVNMQVPVILTHSLLPMLKKQQQAYILNIVSSAAYQAVPGLSVYAASKAFMLRFSRGLRYELRNTTVSVTALSPGSTDTGFAHRAKVGKKGLKAAEKVNMTPEAVARLAVNAMFARKPELITGWVNKLGAFLVWLLPDFISEKAAASIYELD